VIPPLFLMLQLSTLVAQPPGRPCTAEEVAQQESTASLIVRGVPVAPSVSDQPGPAATADDTCLGDRLIRSTLQAWKSARDLASQGGVGELLGPTLKIVNEELERLRAGDLALEAEYAQTAIRAAIAAAQDERPEMELLLAHARDLTERLAARSRRALWPRPFNLLAGELWLEVDRYEDARLAYERAVTDRATPLALSGLARALARLDRHAEACQAYGRMRDDTGPLRDEARAYLARCP
jgi:tetratricopeptide (TPR) repeat protein